MRYDIAIIGGGLTGCASAYYLAKGGARVVVIERGEVNQGASGRNAGSLHFQLEHREIAHGNSLSPALANRVELSRLAIEHWRGLELELQEDLELAMQGGLMLAETPEEVSLLRRKFELEQRHGLNSQLLTAADVRQIAPFLYDGIQAAALCPDEGHCNPRLLTPAFARHAVQLGAEMRTRTSVGEITRVGSHWRLNTVHRTANGTEERESLTVDAILNAAGAWAGDVAGLANYHLPIFPVGLLMNVTERVGPFLPYLIQHVGKRISMKQAHAGNLLIGGGWSVRMRSAAGVTVQGMPESDTIVRNLRVAAQLVPAIEGVHLLRTWSGVTGVTSDQLPLVGEITGSRGFFVAAGGSGFTFGPLYARLISDQILLGRMSDSAAAYSPARFNHINMFMG